MMILDRRETALDKNGNPVRPGGVELHRYLSRYDIDIVTGVELPFADAMFAGNGEDGECVVGIEHKRLSDLINSMKDRRLSGHQLRGLWQAYDYLFLFVEGVWRPGAGGEIEELWGKEWRPLFSSRDRYAVNYRQVAAYLNSLSLRSRSPINGEPLRVVRTQNPRQTAAEYAALYLGFNEKTWEQHHAHDQIYTEMTLPPRRAGVAQAKVTTMWKMVAQLEGLDRRAEQVAEYFQGEGGTLADGLNAMTAATVKEWKRVQGVGKVGADQVWKQLHETVKENGR